MLFLGGGSLGAEPDTLWSGNTAELERHQDAFGGKAVSRIHWRALEGGWEMKKTKMPMRMEGGAEKNHTRKSG